MLNIKNREPPTPQYAENKSLSQKAKNSIV